MKIMLCVINYTRNSSFRRMRFGIWPPLGAGYIASVLIRAGHTVMIKDDAISSDKELSAAILSFKPDVVGFYVYTFSLNNSFEWAAFVKQSDPHCAVVFGGPHPTHLPRQTLANDNVDIVVAGEGEMTMIELADALSRQRPLAGIRGVYFKNPRGEVVFAGDRPLISDLDTVPLPAYEILNIDRYRSTFTRTFSMKRSATIITARGCCYQCAFCSRTLGNSIRYRSPGNVVDEMQFLIDKYGMGEFTFVDDTFSIDKERALAICELIIQRRLGIIWNCNCRADTVSPELLKAFRKSGCRGIFIGAESASQEMLDSMHKNITVEQVRSAVSLAKGIVGHVNCSFIFGMPHDTPERAKKTIAFAKELDPDYAFFTAAIPLPGTKIFDDAVQSGILKIETAQWDTFTVALPPYAPVQLSRISPTELLLLLKQAYREFYLRPSYIVRWLRKLPLVIISHAYLLGKTVTSLVAVFSRSFKEFITR